MVYVCVPGTAAVSGMQFTSAIGGLICWRLVQYPSDSDLYLLFHTKV